MTFAYKEKGSTVDKDEMKSVLQRAPELGCNFLDTSDLYGYVGMCLHSQSLPAALCLMGCVKHDRVPVCADPTRTRR